jgi:hypothetical protein
MGVEATSNATTFILNDKASEAHFNIGSPGATNGNGNVLRNGQYYWDRNNHNPGSASFDHLLDAVQHTYYFRSANMSREMDVNTLSVATAAASNSNTDGRSDRLKVVYRQSTGPDLFTITTIDTLRGTTDGSFLSKMSRQVTVKNDGNAPLTFSFFSYTDLNLTGIRSSQVAGYLPGDAYSDEAPDEFGQIKTVDGRTRAAQWDVHPVHGMISESETTTLGPANHNGGRPDRVQVSTDGSILAALDDLDADNLTGSNSLANKDFGLNGPGDVEYAFQYTFTLAASGSAGDTFVISEATENLPEPASLVLLGLGTALVGLPRRFRKRA